MKNLLVVFLIYTLLPTNGYSDDQGAVYLEIGNPAPWAGFLLSKEKVDKFRLIDISYQEELKKNEFLTKDNTILNERLSNREAQLDKLAERVVEGKDDALWSKIAFFVLGSVLTGAIAVGVSRLK